MMLNAFKPEFVSILFCSLLCSQMAKEIEDKMEARYTMIDKTDPVAIAAAQQAGIPINSAGELVGESDSSGFGVEPTGPGAKLAPTSSINTKKNDIRRRKSRERTK